MSLTAYALAPWTFVPSADFAGQLAAADPTIIIDDGIYRMFYTDGPTDGSVVRAVISGAISADGVTWTQLGGNAADGIVIAGDGGDAANIEAACIFKVGDVFVLLYSGYADIGFPVPQFPATLYAATSTDGVNFTPVTTGPALSPTPGWYDNDAVYSPTVVNTGDGFLMLYAGHSYGDGAAIGGYGGVSLLAATSPDGLSWTKVAEPVLLADPAIAWMSDGVAEPAFIIGPDGNYYLFFTGLHGTERVIGLAVAPDPLGPWDILPQPIITAETSGLPAGSTVIAPHAELVNGVLRLWYTEVTADGAHNVAYAEADWGGGSTTIGTDRHWLGTDLDDVINGAAGADLVTAAGGADLIVTNQGNDTIDAGDGHDGVWAGDGNDNAAGGAGDDSLYGGDGANTILGGDGADLIATGLHNDRLSGGAGDDTIDSGDGTDIVDAGDGDDQVWGGAGNDSILGGIGNDALVGGDGADTIDGGVGADLISGDGGNDVLRGDTGNDTVYAGDEDDVIDAGIDDDLVWSSGGADSVLGGAGDDVLFGGAGADTVDGGDGADLMVGDLDADSLAGGIGDDTIDAGDGADAVLGGAGHDILYGGTGGDTLDGGDGADTLYAGTDDASLATNLLLGGLSNDLLVGFAGTDTLDAGSGNDTLDGGWNRDLLLGGAGTDALYGGDDNDSLAGGAGADLLDGGEGTDAADFSRSGAVTASLEVSIAGAGDAGGDIFVSIENLIGSSTGSDLLVGDWQDNRLDGLGGNDTLDGGAGADVLAGGAGNDLYVVDLAQDVVVELANAGTDTVRTRIGLTLGANLENLAVQAGVTAGLRLVGNVLDNAITGGGGADTLEGGNGADTLDGGTGANRMVGGAGADTYLVNSAADIIVETAAVGTDTVITKVSLTLGAFVENLSVQAGVSAGLTLTGNGLANLIAGGAGNDTLNGGAGADTLAGGIGADLFIINDTTTVALEQAGAGTDTVRTSVSYTLGANIENLAVAAGVSADLSLTGNTLDNIITGGAGSDTILGGGGNDWFSGGAENDSLYGGAGNDTLTGGSGNDLLVGNLGSDIFVFNAAPNAATNADRFIGFSAADDTIHLENAIFTGLGQAIGALSAAAFRSGAGVTTAGDATDRVIYNTTTGDLYYDADGIGGAAAIRFATLDNRAALTTADFVII